MSRRCVVVLCDNESSRKDGPQAIGCEWGLALAIDLGPSPDQGLWLWDTGKTGLFLKNAQTLGVDVNKARGLALSHGHYDHTGGLAALLAQGFRGAVHAHPACSSARYAKEKTGARPIGPPAPLPDFIPASPVTRLAPGLTLLCDIPRAPGRFQAVRGFSFDPEGTRPDPVPDDAFLVMETGQGPVVILGCCHSGLANSLTCASERLGHKTFHAVLGGLHLFEAGQDAVQETAEALARFEVRQLVAGHCTGQDRLATLRNLLPACDVQPLASGQRWTF